MSPKYFVLPAYDQGDADAIFFFLELNPENAEHLLSYREKFIKMKEISGELLEAVRFQDPMGFFATDVHYDDPHNRAAFLNAVAAARRTGLPKEIPRLETENPVEVDSVFMYEPSTVDVDERGILFRSGDSVVSGMIGFNTIEAYVEASGQKKTGPRNRVT